MPSSPHTLAGRQSARAREAEEHRACTGISFIRPIRSRSLFKTPPRFARARSALSRPRAHFNGVLLLRFFFFFLSGISWGSRSEGAFQLLELTSTAHKASALADFLASPRAKLRTFLSRLDVRPWEGSASLRLLPVWESARTDFSLNVSR